MTPKSSSGYNDQYPRLGSSISGRGSHHSQLQNIRSQTSKKPKNYLLHSNNEKNHGKEGRKTGRSTMTVLLVQAPLAPKRRLIVLDDLPITKKVNNSPGTTKRERSPHSLFLE